MIDLDEVKEATQFYARVGESHLLVRIGRGQVDELAEAALRVNAMLDIAIIDGEEVGQQYEGAQLIVIEGIIYDNKAATH